MSAHNDPAHSARETDTDSETTVLSGFKPVCELVERDPARIDMVLVRKGRRSADTDRLLDLCRAQGVRFSLVDAAALERLAESGGSGGSSHQGVMARLLVNTFMPLDELLTQAAHAPLPLIVALDQVQDAGNAGALARTLYALGGGGLITPRHNGVYLGGGARRAAAGALEQLPVARVTNLARALEEAADCGYTVYAAARPDAADATDAPGKSAPSRQSGPEEGSAFTDALRLPAVLVLGSEEHGLRPLVRKHCERAIWIPMLREFDSLNVAQAGGILISCFLRRHLERQAASDARATTHTDKNRGI